MLDSHIHSLWCLYNILTPILVLLALSHLIIVYSRQLQISYFAKLKKYVTSQLKINIVGYLIVWLTIGFFRTSLWIWPNGRYTSLRIGLLHIALSFTGSVSFLTWFIASKQFRSLACGSVCLHEPPPKYLQAPLLQDAMVPQAPGLQNAMVRKLHPTLDGEDYIGW